MARYKTSIDSTMTPQQAFDYMATFSNAAQWDPGALSAKDETGGPPRKGSAYVLQFKFFGSVMPLRYEIIEIDPGKRVVLRAPSGRFDSIDTITIEPRDGGSRVIYDARLRFKGIFRLFDPLLGLMFGSVARKAVKSLRGYLNPKK